MTGSTARWARLAGLSAVIALALLGGTWRSGDGSDASTLVVGVVSIEDQGHLAPLLRFFGASVS